MNKITKPWMPIAATFAFTALAGVVPVLLSESIAVVTTVVIIAFLLGIVGLMVVQAKKQAKAIRRLHDARGVVYTTYGQDRSKDFARLWELPHAKKIFVWGVGMTRVTQDMDMIESTIKNRGVRVEFEMIDPVFLRENPQVSKMLNLYYSRPNFVESVEHSLLQLVRFRDMMNTVYGSDKVSIYVVNIHQAGSGTVVNPGDDDAVGIIEGHTPTFPTGQARLKAVMYKSPNPETEPPRIEMELGSRRRLLRSLVGATAADRLNPNPTYNPIESPEPDPAPTDTPD